MQIDISKHKHQLYIVKIIGHEHPKETNMRVLCFGAEGKIKRLKHFEEGGIYIAIHSSTYKSKPVYTVYKNAGVKSYFSCHELEILSKPVNP